VTTLNISAIAKIVATLNLDITLSPDGAVICRPRGRRFLL
jgi:hypothetical protein